MPNIRQRRKLSLKICELCLAMRFEGHCVIERVTFDYANAWAKRWDRRSPERLGINAQVGDLFMAGLESGVPSPNHHYIGRKSVFAVID